ncbi:MAG TPA: nuclear transport factor 2 family protein [Candidatus Dormibacteraeota bacterium]|nr:nuclear transport factor 2 family protein [Candidatus Dormibacteraeota bacterium]
MRKLMMISAGAGIAAAFLVAGSVAGQPAGRRQPTETQEASARPQATRRQQQRATQGGGAGRESAQQDEGELRALLPKIVSAWESFDVAKVERYYAADPDLMYFDLAPMKYNNWAEYREGVQKLFFEPNQSGKFKINDDLRVHARGRLAWATFTFGADLVSRQGTSSHLNGRWTMVLEKRPIGWIVVHEHVSVPMSGA